MEALTDRRMDKHGRVLDPNREEDFKLIVREASCEYINQSLQGYTGKPLVLFHGQVEGFVEESSLREDVHARR